MSSIVGILLSILLWVVVLVEAHNSAKENLFTKPGCYETCEKSDVLIPFPFGIGKNCYHNSSEHYEIICKPSYSSSSSGASNPFLRKLNIEVFYLGFDTYTFTYYYDELSVPADRYEICTNAKGKNRIRTRNLQGSPFYYHRESRFKVEGSEGHVNIKNPNGEIIGGCSSVGKEDAYARQATYGQGSVCNGLGCCFIEITDYDNNYSSLNRFQYYYDMELSSLSDSVAKNYNTCMSVTLFTANVTTSYLRWDGLHILSQNDVHYDGCTKGALYCRCKYGYIGNPYLYGCKAVTASKRKAVITGLGTSLGSITFLVCGYGLFHVTRRWLRIKRKAKIFKRNGGLLLQQQVTTSDNKVDNTKVFSVDELDKATDSFNANRILGRGGQGTVYKGMLLDGRVVAIKKSLKVDDSQIEQFINEVVILSQINHRNIVKLLGCCLETEVPLLVYEYIQNGTLDQHINNPNEDFHITWKMRLQIAAESAGALTYLHSASGTPIYHRDVKSSNILLDDKYRAKVADFGTSRTLMIDQTHLTTLVQGTLGYLDPEYFQTNQFTEKSDVYSFGVVLIELLTGKKPLSSVPSGGWRSLAMDFLLHMETSRLLEIVDSRIIDEAKEEELLALANVAMRCLNLNGKQRPSMREVAYVLEGIRSPPTLPSNNVCSNDVKEFNETIEMEMMHDGHVAMGTFCSKNVIGGSSSIEVKPLINYTV